MNTNQELIDEVKIMIDDVRKTHRYSMSKIYDLYNRVFNTLEQPQSCASCLIRKVKELTAWHASHADHQMPVAVAPKTKSRKKTNKKQE